MSVEEKVFASKNKVSHLTIVFVCGAFIVAFFCLFNTLLILQAERTLDEIGSQCAYGAAREKDLPSARQAVAKVVAMHNPDEFFIRGPIVSRVAFYDRQSASPGAGSFVTVRTSLTAWIPAPHLFAGAFPCQSDNPNLVELTSTHSSP